ncbi:hypothetical protein [uncultured Roseobacter sp.]|uniref:hypothetical protein n=1 Tax=uncultured Roseobacter sp. TaxID=114847 RepID=UPI002636CAB7|nr:hypothetical protein [uncultured Roseobacter sp.]
MQKGGKRHRVANALDRSERQTAGWAQEETEPPMQDDLSKITLIVRTIGAERGRAARGRPLAG